MRKKAAAALLMCASMAMWAGCGKTSNRFLYAATPGANQIVIFREDPNAGVLTQLAGSPIQPGRESNRWCFILRRNSCMRQTRALTTFRCSQFRARERSPR